MNELIPFAGSQVVSAAASGIAVPKIIADAGDQAARRFLEFFAATIRNKNAQFIAVCSAYLLAVELCIGALFSNQLHENRGYH